MTGAYLGVYSRYDAQFNKSLKMNMINN